MFEDWSNGYTGMLGKMDRNGCNSADKPPGT